MNRIEMKVFNSVFLPREVYSFLNISHLQEPLMWLSDTLPVKTQSQYAVKKLKRDDVLNIPQSIQARL